MFENCKVLIQVNQEPECQLLKHSIDYQGFLKDNIYVSLLLLVTNMTYGHKYDEHLESKLDCCFSQQLNILTNFTQICML